MRTLTVAAFFILLALEAFADCSSGGLAVFPKGKNISQNPAIMVESYTSTGDIITDASSSRRFYLVSGQEKVRLLTKEICVGEFMCTQAIFKPERELEAGAVYELILYGQPEQNSHGNRNIQNDTSILATFKVSDGVDIINPVIKNRPRLITKELTYYGCGPASYVIFNCPETDDSAYMVLATVWNVKTQRSTTYYLIPRDSQVYVGHGMCSGAFTFDEGDEFEVGFSIVDLSGNLTQWTEQPIRFTKPTYKDQASYKEKSKE